MVKTNDDYRRWLNRREFNHLAAFSLGAASGMLALPSCASALEAVTGAASTGARRTVKFPDGAAVPALGQGSAQLAQGRHPQAVEEEALRTGLSLGMTLIDTAELYGDGRSEEFVGRIIAGQRDRVFLVSKVCPVMRRGAVSHAPARRVWLVSARTISISTSRRPMRDESGPLQRRRSRHRTRPAALVRAAQHAGDGLFTAGRPRQPPAA
jgi:aldo/keto reductase family protein